MHSSRAIKQAWHHLKHSSILPGTVITQRQQTVQQHETLLPGACHELHVFVSDSLSFQFSGLHACKKSLRIHSA